MDNLIAVLDNPVKFFQNISSKPWNFKLEGTGPLSYHLGCGFTRDEIGVLCMDATKYISRFEDSYERIFGQKPTQDIKSPLEKNDHPELDDSPFLDDKWTQIYQSIIGSTQWTVSTGHFELNSTIMILSRFQAAPREDHLARLKRVYDFISKFRYFKIQFRTCDVVLDIISRLTKR